MRATTIDWSIATISSASLLVHFGLLATIYSDWCDPVVVDDEVAVAGVVQALMALAPPAPTDSELVASELQVTVPEPVAGALRPFTPVGYAPVDPPTDPDWSDLDGLALTDPDSAGVVKRAKLVRAKLDATLRGFGSDSPGHGRSLPRGNATVRSALVTQGTVSNAARITAGMRAGFRTCYQLGLAENPNATGTIDLTLRVGPTGAVEGVTTASSGSLSKELTSCVEARARIAEFAAPDQGSAIIRVPLAFSRY